YYKNLYYILSSRRRHTIFSRDWSSDVCSSDLLPTGSELNSLAPRKAGQGPLSFGIFTDIGMELEPQGMDIAILSVSLNVYSTRRLAIEAEKAGHYVELIDHTKCSVKLGQAGPQIYLGTDNITDEFDAVIPRIGTTVTRHGAAIVKQFE